MGKNGKAKQDGAECVEQLATRITRSSHRALQYLALDRETTVQALVQEALDALLAKTPRAPAVEDDPTSRAVRTHGQSEPGHLLVEVIDLPARGSRELREAAGGERHAHGDLLAFKVPLRYQRARDRMIRAETR